MATSGKEIAQQWFREVWDEGNVATIDRLFAADGIAHGLVDEQGNLMRGPKGFKPFHAKLRGALPDMKVEIADLISEGDGVVARCIVRGTHHGDHLGIPASGKPVQFAGVAILRIADGKIAEAWNNFDFDIMTQQIGVTAQPASQRAKV